MDMNWGKRIWVACAIIGASLLGKESFAEQIWFQDETLEVALEGERDLLIVANSNDGDIFVRGEDRDSIEVTLDKFEADDSKRNRASIEVDLEEGLVKLILHGKLQKSDVVIVVPRSVSLRLRAIDGDVVVDDIAGEIEINAVDGEVHLREVSGGIVANSVDGSVRAELSDVGLVNPISLATVDGDVHLITGENTNANFSVSSIDGTFDSDLPFKVESSGRKWGSMVGIHVSGIYGEGGPSISLKTIDGDILVAVRD